MRKTILIGYKILIKIALVLISLQTYLILAIRDGKLVNDSARTTLLLLLFLITVGSILLLLLRCLHFSIRI